MDPYPTEHWHYTVAPKHADVVYLVVDCPTMPSRWVPMQPREDLPGHWSVTTEITPGRTRVRYFVAEGKAYLNCGDVGLHGQPAEPYAEQTPEALAASV